jgi:hypothetical protein
VHYRITANLQPCSAKEKVFRSSKVLFLGFLCFVNRSCILYRTIYVLNTMFSICSKFTGIEGIVLEPSNGVVVCEPGKESANGFTSTEPRGFLTKFSRL